MTSRDPHAYVPLEHPGNHAHGPPPPLAHAHAAHNTSTFSGVLGKNAHHVYQGCGIRLEVAWKFGRWFLVCVPFGAVVGAVCAFFLWLLDQTTEFRQDNKWLIYLLPAGGIAVHLLYTLLTPTGKAMNVDLLFREIHGSGSTLSGAQAAKVGEASPTAVPPQLAPLVLIGTLVTHLFGGSVGREGTALQMAGGICAGYLYLLAKLPGNLRLAKDTSQTLFKAALAAGFGGVFGTPLAGAIFAMEVIDGATTNLLDIVPCLLASLAADFTGRKLIASVPGWDIAKHTEYEKLMKTWNDIPHSNLLFNLKVLTASIFFGLCSVMFIHMAHFFQDISKLFTTKWTKLIPALIGGGLTIGIYSLLQIYDDGPTGRFHAEDYLGIGTKRAYNGSVVLTSAFTAEGAVPTSWLWKLILTAIAVGSGYKGGEVTPLFFMGAMLGNSMAHLLQETNHTDAFAALGMVAVFAGATNTPLACTIMGAELFAGTHIVYLAEACFVAYLVSAHASVYAQQNKGKQLAKLTSFRLEPGETFNEMAGL